MMRILVTLIGAFFVSSLCEAFSVSPLSPHIRINSSLYLFGGKKKDGAKKGPGMMDQLAMFKKAQEMTKKKKKLDEELASMKFEGSGAAGKVKASFKYIPSPHPMDPNPGYLPVGFTFDDEFYQTSSPDQIATGIKESIMSGIEMMNNATIEKYAVLQKDLMDSMQKQQ